MLEPDPGGRRTIFFKAEDDNHEYYSLKRDSHLFFKMMPCSSVPLTAGFFLLQIYIYERMMWIRAKTPARIPCIQKTILTAMRAVHMHTSKYTSVNNIRACLVYCQVSTCLNNPTITNALKDIQNGYQKISLPRRTKNICSFLLSDTVNEPTIWTFEIFHHIWKNISFRAA